MSRVVSWLVCIAALSGNLTYAQQLRAVPYVTGLDWPVGFVPHPTNPELQYVVEKPGRIRVIERGVLRSEVFLDLTHAIDSRGFEQGLLGLVFDPDYEQNRRFWVNFTAGPLTPATQPEVPRHTVIARFARRADDPYRADESSRFDLLFAEPDHRFIEQPHFVHNGGKMFFGADGYLYIAMGDGGTDSDPSRKPQDRSSLLGKLLRIDPRVPDVGAVPPGHDDEVAAWRGYRIPPDNPFVHDPATRSEIWAFGLRNPWRVTMDDPRLGGTGGIFIADVGEACSEEVSYEPRGAGGRNYGWPLFEGTLPNPSVPEGEPPAFLPLTPPVFEYVRCGGEPNFGRSIIGGHRYRGRLLGPAMYGRYVFGDMVGWIHSIALEVDPATEDASASDFRSAWGLAPSGSFQTSIDADLHGELFVTYLFGAFGGTIFRLTTDDDQDANGLSDTWEALFGLPALGPALGGPFGDPNGDGIVNAEAFRRGLHPTGHPVAYFAEGATGFFGTRVSVLNDGDTPAVAVVHWQTADDRESAQTLAIPAARVALADAAAGGHPPLGSAEFGTRIDAEVPLAAARTMTWPAGPTPYGSHSEHGAAGPGTVWHFAEGATTIFELFYLLQNPADEEAHVRIDYLVQGVGALERTYVVPARARRTVWVNQEPGLQSAELGATITSTNGVPIFAERAMYTRGALLFPAGTAAAGEPALAPRWFFAEGATGTFFDTFLAVANPYDEPLAVEYRVYLPDGATAGAPLTFTAVAPPRERLTIWLDEMTTDDGVSLADQSGLSVEVLADRPFIAERAMWWAGLPTEWHEGHAVAGFAGGPRAQWRLAGGEVHVAPGGVVPSVETYALIANVGPVDEDVTVTIYFTDRAPIAIPIIVAAHSRYTFPLLRNELRAYIPEGQRVDVGVRVDAASPAAQLYVEQAVYSTPPGGPFWAGGSAHRATP